MAQFINTNIASLNAQRNLTTSQLNLQTSLQRLSSGLRINSAKDDAAGLAISERMTTQVRGLDQGVRNLNDGISLSQTAEGALLTIGDMFQRMRELAVQASNETNTLADRASMQSEFTKLSTEATRITAATKFNGVTMINAANTFKFQAGANTGDTITVNTVDASVVISTAIASGLTGSDQTNAQLTIGLMDTAIDAITTQRGDLGAAQNSMQYALQNLMNASENQSAARSRIQDTDFAAETGRLTRSQILQQAGTAMLAQANAVPNGVMALLR